MQFYSLKDKSHKASFINAMINGLTPDNSLYFPEEIPQFSEEFFTNLGNMTLPDIAFHVMKPYVGDDLSNDDLREITKEVFNFEIPLVNLEKNIYTLELFHGPTLAFKDIGARFLAKCMQKAVKNKTMRVLVATSGDTGSAVANGFLGIEGTEVIVLYPKGKVSELQQKQFATLGQNIKPIAIEGTFDDCQALVKAAFIDAELNNKMNLTSANSINVARWIPQSVYYYWLVAQLEQNGTDIAVCVPSGNLGNITSGILAKKTGLPIKHFIAASNNNDIIPQFIDSGVYNPKPSVQTMANAMDVGNPNNFPRLLELYNGDFDKIKEELYGEAFTDNNIKALINKCFIDNGYLLDPHGATGFGAIKNFSQKHFCRGVFLETAHPGKFVEDVEKTIGQSIELPDKLKAFAKREINAQTMKANYIHFKSYLLETC